MSTKMKVKEAGTYTHKDMAERAARPSFTKSLKESLHLDTSEFCKINWYYPGGREAFPAQPRMWTVDRCYPYTKQGQILVDIVILPHKREEAKKKHEYFKTKGMRYVALDRGAEVIDFDQKDILA
jgi:hypothetical protein